MDGHTRSSQRVQWNASGRLQLIEAVITVESMAIMNRSNRENRCSISSVTSKKWESIANLLPVEFRGKLWDSQTHKYKGYKCTTMFSNVMRAFRQKLGKGPKYSSNAVKITEAEFQMLKKREDLLKARCTVRDAPNSELHNGNTKEDESSEEQPTGFETKGDDSSFPGQPGESGSLARSERSSQHDRLGHIDDESDTTQCEGQDRSADKGERVHMDPTKDSNEKKTSTPGLGSASRSPKESTGLAKKAKPTGSNRNETRARTRAQTRCKGRSGTKTTMGRPAGQLKNSRTAWTQLPNSKIQSIHGELLHAFVERPLRRVDMELSNLSSWVQTQAVPFVKRVMNESTSAEKLSSAYKKRKVSAQPPHAGSAPEAVDGLMLNTSTEMVEHQICAMFHKLRNRFLDDLQNTCTEMAREVVEAMPVLSHISVTSPASTAIQTEGDQL